ncbi:cytochrome b-c1 complex subunit 7 isoform X2 [Ooceraea biroi]|uniref:cytochrome b-c1 complex subunit 7 isoform X2 n=1 Tax=Ooceraea biroi TaxID=2015173 RepID=UPI000F081F8E|nr:cytochrome b-c1 complex subunit 7 isoform X2 [Ooceraea biroi]
MCYNLSGFNQLGLWRDDFLYEADPDVTEALRRVPRQVIDERNFRIVRAMQLDAQKKILPKEQWTKFEDDILYLSQHVEDVKKEREEKERWEDS